MEAAEQRVEGHGHEHRGFHATRPREALDRHPLDQLAERLTAELIPTNRLPGDRVDGWDRIRTVRVQRRFDHPMELHPLEQRHPERPFRGLHDLVVTQMEERRPQRGLLRPGQLGREPGVGTVGVDHLIQVGSQSPQRLGVMDVGFGGEVLLGLLHHPPIHLGGQTIDGVDDHGCRGGRELTPYQRLTDHLMSSEGVRQVDLPLGLTRRDPDLVADPRPQRRLRLQRREIGLFGLHQQRGLQLRQLRLDRIHIPQRLTSLRRRQRPQPPTIRPPHPSGATSGSVIGCRARTTRVAHNRQPLPDRPDQPRNLMHPGRGGGARR